MQIVRVDYPTACLNYGKMMMRHRKSKEKTCLCFLSGCLNESLAFLTVFIFSLFKTMKPNLITIKQETKLSLVRGSQFP